ncbi:MAG: helix-turn-helix domain-containing protein [Bacillota bacterium]|jgi:ribosome-binding protein aMBF1 (putative translation factor)
MFFELRNHNKTVKELRKNQGYTAQELATKLKVDTPVILKIDHLPLKEVPPKIKAKILPVLRGDYMNKIPW